VIGGDAYHVLFDEELSRMEKEQIYKALMRLGEFFVMAG